jgi:SPP1 family predicted phage head-tail adaptor
MINPGELNTPITLKSRSIITGGSAAAGFRIPSYDEIGQVLAKWVNVHGSEVWSSQTVNAMKAATVLIRYQAGLDETCVVDKGGEVYDIVSIDDIQERHEYMELKIKKAVGG